MKSFDFMDKPQMQTLVAAMKQLYHILDDEGLLTELGCSEFPLDPICCQKSSLCQFVWGAVTRL